MNDDTRHILDDLLCQWHHWANGYRYVAGYSPQPMHKHAVSPRHWQPAYELMEEQTDVATMKAIQFIVVGDEHGQGGLPLAQSTAIQINARNLATGRNVWTSARLPTDLQERAILLAEARNALMRRLIDAGVV